MTSEGLGDSEHSGPDSAKDSRTCRPGPDTDLKKGGAPVEAKEGMLQACAWSSRLPAGLRCKQTHAAFNKLDSKPRLWTRQRPTASSVASLSGATLNTLNKLSRQR